MNFKGTKPNLDEVSEFKFDLNWKSGLAIILTIFILLTLIISFTIVGISGWFDKNKVTFQQVIKIEIHQPFIIEERKIPTENIYE